MEYLCIPIDDCDTTHGFFRLGSDEINGKQSVFEISTTDFHSIREQKHALELPRRDAAVKKNPLAFVGLATPDHELFVLQGHIQLIARETGNSQRDTD